MPRPKTVDPTAEQLASGQYRRALVMHAESATGAAAYVSRHDPVQRWLEAKRLTDTQEVAIAFVRRLWELVGTDPKVTATYGEKTPPGNVEQRVLSVLEADEDLKRVISYFPKDEFGKRPYWDLFENVCRWGEPAGVAGSRLGFGDRSAQDRAHQIVCFVADIIAMRERL